MGRLHWPALSPEENVFGSLPNFCCPERRSGWNRIGHPDWVKLCVELNCAPNQNTFCYTRMKSLMHSYAHWPNMNKDIKNIVKSCKGCGEAAKAPPIKYSPSPKMDQPWSHIYRDFAGPLDGIYNLIVVDNVSKWPEVLRCRNPTPEVSINFFRELFARFGVVDCPVSNNETQIISGDFKDFWVIFKINHITIVPYHPRSNGQAERFVDTLKTALKKARGTPPGKTLQQFLQVYIELRPTITHHHHYPSRGNVCA